jgi:hypothetical protein
MMHKSFVALVILLAACAANRSDAPPPKWLVGKYHYSGNGTVAKKFPWEAKADLLLEADHQYTLTVSVHINDEKGGDTDSDETYGTYYVDGDKLILEAANDDDTEEFQISNGRLIPKLPWTAKLALKGFGVSNPVFVKTD